MEQGNDPLSLMRSRGRGGGTCLVPLLRSKVSIDKHSGVLAGLAEERNGNAFDTSTAATNGGLECLAAAPHARLLHILSNQQCSDS